MSPRRRPHWSRPRPPARVGILLDHGALGLPAPRRWWLGAVAVSLLLGLALGATLGCASPQGDPRVVALCEAQLQACQGYLTQLCRDSDELCPDRAENASRVARYDRECMRRYDECWELAVTLPAPVEAP